MDLSVATWQTIPISFYDKARQKDWSILCFLCGMSQQWWLVKCQWLCRLLWSHWLPFLHKFSNLCFLCFPVSFLFVLNRLFIWYKHGHFEIVKNYLTHLFGLITCYESFRHYFNVLFEWPTHFAWTRIKIRSWKSIGNEWPQPVCLGLDLLGQ